MKNGDDVVWGLLFGTLVAAIVIYLAGYIALATRLSPQATVADIMAHWPQLTDAPSLKGLRGEVGGMPIPDHINLGKLPKAGIVWPCTDDAEVVQLCYLNADFSRPAGRAGLDLAQDHHGKYIFIVSEGVGK